MAAPIFVGHPTIDTQPCAFGHYAVRLSEMWIADDDGLTYWRTARICLQCNPVSANVKAGEQPWRP